MARSPANSPGVTSSYRANGEASLLTPPRSTELGPRSILSSVDQEWTKSPSMRTSVALYRSQRWYWWQPGGSAGRRVDLVASAESRCLRPARRAALAAAGTQSKACLLYTSDAAD